MDNPFENLTSRIAIKKAYRKLCLTCHPDVRPDKEKAAEEFRELTRIYETALAMLGKPKPPPPPPPRPKPKPKPNNGPIIEQGYIEAVDDFEIMNFGKIVRTVRVSPEILEYGGMLQIYARYPGGYADHLFQFRIPPHTPNGQKFRYKGLIAIWEITVVGERK